MDSGLWQNAALDSELCPSDVPKAADPPSAFCSESPGAGYLWLLFHKERGELGWEAVPAIVTYISIFPFPSWGNQGSWRVGIIPTTEKAWRTGLTLSSPEAGSMG